jgi:cell division septal protein FtsQ
MAQKTTKRNTKKTSNTNTGKRKDRQKYFRVTMLFAGIIITIALLGTLFWGAALVLFSRNPHFTLKHINVQSSGWWNGRERLVASKLDLLLGKSNIFESNLYQLKRKVERLPGVETAAISRILPDTFQIQVIERIPRAYLGSSRSKWVVDSNGIVMAARYCLNLKRGLPIILGYEPKAPLKTGMDIPEIEQALSLIMLTIRDYPNIKISAISIRDPEKLTFVMAYKGRKRYKVFMPRKRLKFMLAVLKSAILKAQRNGDPRSVINLTFNGNVVFK